MADYSLKNNKVLGFNLAAEYIYSTKKAEIIEMITLSDFLFCNKEEALAGAMHL